MLRTLRKPLKSKSTPNLRAVNTIQPLAKLTGVGCLSSHMELAPNQPNEFFRIGIEARKHRL
jgi:hypothetical protein